jgi:hypothetical protein
MQKITPSDEINFQKDMQEEQIAADPNSVYADSLREEKVKNIISQINPNALLEEIEHRIRGEKFDYLTQQWDLIPGREKISEELVQNFISFLSVYLTQNNSLSNFSSQEINSIMNVITDYVRDDLTDNAERYGLTKKETIKILKEVKVMKPHINQEGMKCFVYEPAVIEQEMQVGDEITDYDTLSRIGHIVCQSTFSVLKQAQNGMLASRVFKALRVNETINQGGQKSKMDFLKFW